MTWIEIMHTLAEKLISSFPFNLTPIFFGALLLGLGTPTQGIESYLVIILVAVSSTGSILLLYRNTEQTGGRIAPIGLLLILLNLLVAYVCLKNWAAPNNIIILGAWFLISSYIFCLAGNISHKSVRRHWLMVNVVFAAFLVLIPPNINGATLSLKRLSVPTHFSIYPGSGQFRRPTQHSQRFEHFHGPKPLKVALHSPVASNKDRRITLRVHPSRTSSVELEGITLDNYVGYKRTTLGGIWKEALWEIPISFAAENGSRSNEKGGVKMVIPRYALIDLSVPLFGRPLGISMNLKHIRRSIVLWELVFCAFFLLAPLDRRGSGGA